VPRTACLRALSCILLLALPACATIYVARADMLWHPDHPVGIPDLTTAGWQRVDIDGADVAFQRNGSGVIAVRVRCPAPDDDVPLRWEARGLWLGVPRGDMERFYMDVDGYEGVSISAPHGDVMLRTLVVRTEACSLDVAQLAADPVEGVRVFEQFVAGVKLHPEVL
jgi:hypothetical protein